MESINAQKEGVPDKTWQEHWAIGTAPFVYPVKDSELEYNLRVEPKTKILQVEYPDGHSIWIGFDDLLVLRDPGENYVDPEIYFWIRKSVEETSWYYYNLVAVPEMMAEADSSPVSGPGICHQYFEWASPQGNYRIEAYPEQEIFKLMMPDNKFVWNSYEGLTANKEYFQGFDNGSLYKFMLQVLKITDGQILDLKAWNTFESISKEMQETRRGGVQAFRMEIEADQTYSIVIDPNKDIICTYYPARCIPTQASRFYKDNSGLIGLHRGNVEKWFLQKIAEAGGNVDEVMQGRRESEVINIPENKLALTDPPKKDEAHERKD
jgi:hypothetical protein